MGKKVINSLTKKDGNKLGRRKQKMYNDKHLDYFIMFNGKGVVIERMLDSELNDKPDTNIAEWIPNEISMERRSMLPSFAGPISEMLSMDHGIKAGDFAAMSTCMVGSGVDDHWRSDTHTQMVMSAIKHDIPMTTICLEDTHEEVVSKVLGTIKSYEKPAMLKPYIHQTDSEFYQQIEKYKAEYDKNNDDHHTAWCGPVFDSNMLPISRSINTDNVVMNEIFLRARTCGKSINIPTPIVGVECK